MARKLRLEYAGACYHVINRGIGGASSVSSLATRFQRKGLEGAAKLQALCSQFAT